MLAYDYPLLGAFWTMLWLFLFFIWIWILISVFIDIFRSEDLGGWAKALWVIFVVILPFLGVLVYLIKQAAQQEKEFRGYVQQVAGDSNPADQLAKLADLKDRGVITEDEFASQKAKILAS